MALSPVSNQADVSVHPSVKPVSHPNVSETSARDIHSRSDTVSIGKGNDENNAATYAYPGIKTANAPSEDLSSSENENAENDQATKDGGDSKTSATNTSESEYTQEEQKKIAKLKERDREVKTHEQAHIAAGGSHVRGGAHFEYQTGPDGKKYAVGGEVSIDVSREPDDPRATIAKMQVVIQAALAPAEPSSQDRAVAAKASRIVSDSRTQALSTEQPIQTDNQKSADQTEEKTERSSSSENLPITRSGRIDQYV